jgi:hypothetical protein
MVGEDTAQLFREEVHVAFLGWAIERIAKPVLQMNGDRLIIICFPREKEHAWAYLDEIKSLLKEKNINMDIIESSLYKLVDLVSILNKIFQVERTKGNEIFINVSAGTKISACASTIASMSTPDVTAYYVHTKEYLPIVEGIKPPKTLTSGIEKILPLPECQIEVPESKYIKTLHLINRLSNEKNRGRIYIKDLIEYLKNEELISVKKNDNPRKQASSEYMATNALIRPLEKWEYIIKSPKKRNKFLTITPKGLNAIKMHLDFSLSREKLAEGGDINNWIEELDQIEESKY